MKHGMEGGCNSSSGHTQLSSERGLDKSDSDST